MFNGHRVSVRTDDNIMEMYSGNGHAGRWTVHLKVLKRVNLCYLHFAAEMIPRWHYW